MPYVLPLICEAGSLVTLSVPVLLSLCIMPYCDEVTVPASSTETVSAESTNIPPYSPASIYVPSSFRLPLLISTTASVACPLFRAILPVRKTTSALIMISPIKVLLLRSIVPLVSRVKLPSTSLSRVTVSPGCIAARAAARVSYPVSPIFATAFAVTPFSPSVLPFSPVVPLPLSPLVPLPPSVPLPPFVPLPLSPLVPLPLSPLVPLPPSPVVPLPPVVPPPFVPLPPAAPPPFSPAVPLSS